MVNRRYVCIICPNSCEIEVKYTKAGGRIEKISGNMCEKGVEYVKKEILHPERGLTTTVKVKNGSLPLVSVKTSKTIPKGMMMEVMCGISKLEVEAPVRIGDVLAANILGTGADIVATKDINKKVEYIRVTK
jgi:CxxC motif-containing protein